MTLYIDSRNNTQLILKLNDIEKVISYDSPRDQDLLRAISSFLEEEQLDKTQLTAIEVEVGPGAFTSIRVGLTIAQALAWSLNIPINGQPAGSVIDADYGLPANITTTSKY